jgi:MscS family membrane protein
MWSPGTRISVLAALTLALTLPSAASPADPPQLERGAQAASGVEAPRGAESPRAAYASFLDLMGRHRSDLAVSGGLFDLVTDDPDRAGQLAGELYAILLRIDVWEPDRISADPDATPPVSVPVRAILSGVDERLRFERGDDGRWRFGTDLGVWVDDTYAMVADLPLRDDVLDDLDLLERLHLELRRRLPAGLRGTAFVIENWQWPALGILLLAGIAVGRTVRGLLALLARRTTGREGLQHVTKELAGFNRPAGLFVSATVFGWLLPLAGLEGQVLAAVAFAARLVATFAGLWAAYRAVDLLCGILEERARKTHNRFDDILVPLLRTTLHVFVVLVGIVYLAAEWTDQLWSVVAGLSIGSLAVGFAARDSIENLFGTFTVLVDKPFVLGDWIVVDGIEGTVESVGFRSTKIRTFWDSIQSVPNRRFISSVVQNYGHRRKRRIKTTLRLALDTPADLVDAFCEGVRELIRCRPTSVPGNYVYLYDLGTDALEVLLYTFVETPDWDSEMREKHGLLADVLRLAERLGIRLAAPARTVALEDRERRSHVDAGEDGPDLGRRTARALADGDR